MTDKAWKKYERWVAEDLNGIREPITGRQRGDKPDVSHSDYSIECKQRAKNRPVPNWIVDALSQADSSRVGDDQTAIVCVHVTGDEHEDDIVMMRWRDFKRLHFAANG